MVQEGGDTFAYEVESCPSSASSGVSKFLNDVQPFGGRLEIVFSRGMWEIITNPWTFELNHSPLCSILILPFGPGCLCHGAQTMGIGV